MDSRTAINFALSGINGAFVGVSMIGIHLLITRRARDWLRRRSLLVEILLDGAAITVVGVLAQIIAQMVLFGESLADITSFVPAQIAFALAWALVFVASAHIVRQIGARQFLSVLVGRYRRPVEEWRIFLFVDLKGATRLAETLGPVQVATLLARFFRDVDGTITDHGGEVHSYVGDCIIVTWTLRSGIVDAACVRCVFAMRHRIAQLAESYRREFGVVPDFRAVLHCGPVVVSEIGLSKEQVTYFGDTVNVAARLEQYAKESDQRFVVSGDLVDRLQPDGSYAVDDLGPASLRGRAEPVRVFAVASVP